MLMQPDIDPVAFSIGRSRCAGTGWCTSLASPRAGGWSPADRASVAIWQGGMSFHGGLPGVILAMAYAF